ncbi:carbohydrate ABC transporter permease [Alicyclobacillus dauci]|uniref:Sugar ABC transporter permease n=1 Tax=Alicyclobacillus dauci TaxID=1475485 RepID=A0ABY6Z9T3_9BACL|nr:sugar ABC transporter permease [Alicyclobacillus dauci]WAH38855.1 sugar ABC transporter permease [Alicyclobacillus dauci]
MNSAMEQNLQVAKDAPIRAADVKWTRKYRPYLVLAPSLLLTIGVLYPFFMAIYYSLTNFSFKQPTYTFIGFENYVNMFSDPSFWHGTLVTTEYAILSTGFELLLGIGIAMLLNMQNWFSKVMRMVLVFPLMIAPVIATLIWQLMTNPSVGVIAHYLRIIGLGGFKWGASPHSALFSVVIIDVWVYTPFVILLVLAGLQSLPKSPFEAAELDGGSQWFTFKNLTLPLLMPFIMIALIFRLMLSTQEFEIIFALTNGGPGDTLMSLSLMSYNQGFLNMNFGSALTYMIFLWVIVYIVSQFLVNYWMKAQKKASGM